ncbi:peptidoglycan bridge formation glycyltransferase FemA/FemB family protein [Weissella diestrammenae]|uniref:Peptidoglycan bridge formation glycyltransferase FemA/FemB family protein n=1 Tax=Weissella diestrammenae TaxID=1162633 RepID=A0A7G9T6L2_9LACO|nr:peptidoglycan bridge formation glycyltransferase FemA/FemB family protein [Weissella diestrammenae]MCM0582985.1 peptidoglycan bridge formation glycyltransferase FemA/FemB family protein [Weissella diestrammenae]QNN75737.1 peptidoglycan bridge formation glycyltransferase FemA/FemB family protein [Weissella diestrammenae]
MPVLDINDKKAVARYQEFVRASPFGQVTQDLAWSEVKNNWTPRYAYVENAHGDIIAAISMLLTDTPSGKKFAYASKGPVMDMHDLDLFDKLIVEAKKAIQDDNVYLLRLDPEVIYSDDFNAELQAHGYQTRNRNVANQGMHATIQPRLNMVLDLTEKPDAKETFDLYPSKTKSKLKRPIRDGVTVKWAADQAAIDAFFETYAGMAQRHGISHRPKAYFDRMLNAFGQNGDILRVYLAEREGQLLSTGIGFKYGQKIWYMYAGSFDGNIYYAPYAVQTAMIQWALDAHVAAYDMGGIEAVDEHDGLYIFKHTFVKADPREYIGEIDVVLDEQVYHELVKS